MGDLPPVGSGEGEGIIGLVDVNGDGQVTPLDILIIINHLNNPNGTPANSNSTSDTVPGGTGTPRPIPRSQAQGEAGSDVPPSPEENRRRNT